MNETDTDYFDIDGVDELQFPEYQRDVDLTLEAMKVTTQGQVYIPASVVREHDLADTYVDFLVHIGGGQVFSVDDAKVASKGTAPGRTLTIPSRKRDLYGVEQGDYVDIHIDGVVARDTNE